MQSLRNYMTREGWKNDWGETCQDFGKGLEAVVKAARKPVDLYQNNRYVNMNTNVLLASAPDIEAGGFASACMAEAGCSPGAITAGTTVASWLAYLPVHIGLHYFSNRKKFRKEDGSLDKTAFWKDVGKVYKTQIPSIALFYAIASPIQYALTKQGVDAHSASRMSYWGTLAITRAVHTVNYWLAERKEKACSTREETV